MKTRSIKYEISVLYVLILGFILIAYRIFLYVDLSNKLYRNTDKQLMLETKELGNRVSQFDISERALIRNFLLETGEAILGDDWFCLFNTKGELLAKSENYRYGYSPFLTDDFKRLQGSRPIFRNMAIAGKNFRTASVFFSPIGKENYVVQIGHPIDALKALLRNRIYDSLIGIPIILLIAHLLGRLLVKRILTPVQKITRAVEAISLKDLSARVDPQHFEKEIEYLANSFNQMLARLDRSFEYIKEFSASIGHELKTPLAIIRGESEIALRKEKSIKDYQKVLNVIIEESNRMVHIVEDLVFLTKLDYNPDNIKKEHFDFIQFFAEIQQRVHTLVSQKQISLSVTMPEISVIVEGNKLHLSRLFFNLIQNAIKFTPSGGRISLSIHPEDEVLKVFISDTGPGIREEDLPRIFQRFFHKDVTRTEKTEGIGLGLSIAKAIAKFHNGDIEVKSKLREGSTFTVIMPIFHA